VLLCVEMKTETCTGEQVLRSKFPPMQAHNFPFAFFHVVEGVRFGASETVAQ